MENMLTTIPANLEDGDDLYGEKEEEGQEEYEETKEEITEGSVLEPECQQKRYSVHITQDTLREVQRELCQIKLCWPPARREEDYLSTSPSTYSLVDNKERLILWYAENLRKQHHTLYTSRKQLVLGCENEFGVQKFVSTSIRRSTIQYPEFYTWQGCAKFVSDFIEYEPPDKPLIAPIRLHSPTWLIEHQKGNSFECSTLLVSFLLGQGYNAFVVNGCASKEQAECDLTRISCPYLPPETPPPTPKVQEIMKYKLLPPPDFTSQFVRRMEEIERQKVLAEKQRQKEAHDRLIWELEQPPPDKYRGYRRHAWVLMLPKRGNVREQEVPEPFFIECSTGIAYRLTDPETDLLYLGVESVWNDGNYWVNMQPCTKSNKDISWDLTKTEHWERLLPGEPWWMRAAGGSTMEEDIEVDKHLDMPASYVHEINIKSFEYEKRYPNGSKTIFYKKAKVDLYAPYVLLDGLVQCVITYDDYKYENPIQCYKKYRNRCDNLISSRKSSDTNQVVNCYKRGRPDACKEHTYFASEPDSIESRRIVEFYDIVRLDGLSRFEAHSTQLVQHYHGRKDFLYYRNIEFLPEENTKTPGQRPIWKIIEHYHRNEALPASTDIAVREFAIGENELRLQFHYEKDRSTRLTRVYTTPPPANRGERLRWSDTITHGYNPDPLPPRQKWLSLFYELGEHLTAEDQAVSFVQEAETELLTFIKTCSYEQSDPKLEFSIFDQNRFVNLQTVTETKADLSSVAREEEDALSPYLARIGNPKHVSKAQAFVLKLDCLSDYKQLQVDRANNMLQKCNEQQQKLNNMEAFLKQNPDLPRELEEKIAAEMNDTYFTLHTLQVRLNRHKAYVPERYESLVKSVEKSTLSKESYHKS